MPGVRWLVPQWVQIFLIASRGGADNACTRQVSGQREILPCINTAVHTYSLCVTRRGKVSVNRLVRSCL